MELFYQWLWRLIPGNPLVVRIVQGGSGRTRHMWIRTGYLGLLSTIVILSLLVFGLHDSQEITQLAKAGAQLFKLISITQILLICLLAPIFMSAAITSEQSGQTFNILLTTPLSNLQIVLGSLVGRLFFVLALVFSGLPLFAIVLIFGGIPVESILISFVASVFSAVMVGSVAITLAVWRAGGRRAVFAFVISVAVYLIAGWFFDSVFRSALQVAPQTITWLTPIHPVLVLQASFNDQFYQPVPESVLAQYSAPVRFYLGHPAAAFALISATLSMFLVVSSTVVVRWIVEREGVPGLLSRLTSPRASSGRKARTVGRNPIAWREANTRGNRAVSVLARWGFAALMLSAAAWTIYLYHHGGGDAKVMSYDLMNQILDSLMLVEFGVIMMVAVYMSAGSVSKEREDGTLDLILTTPVTQKFYIWGKLRGLVSFLALLISLPVLTSAMLTVSMLWARFNGWPTHEASFFQGSNSSPAPITTLEAPFLVAVVLVGFTSLCCLTGVYWSVRAKSVLGAIVPTVVIMGALVTIFWGCGSNMSANVPFLGPAINSLSPTSGILMFVTPWPHVADSLSNKTGTRFQMLMSAVVAGAVYAGLVWSLLSTIVASFDFTVRKLSGRGA